MKFIIVFWSLLFTALFINVKITSFARAIAFSEYESNRDSKLSFLLMLLSVIFWSIFISFF